MPNDLDQTIKDNVAGPKRAKGDGGEVEQHAPKDQIDADRYLNSKQVMKKKGLGIKITRALPHGSV